MMGSTSVLVRQISVVASYRTLLIDGAASSTRLSLALHQEHGIFIWSWWVLRLPTMTT
jgi:hypothetical protein